MSRLEDLAKTVDSMSLDELNELVREIRKDRLTSKRIQATSSKVSRVKKQDSVKGLLDSLTPEQRAEVLAKLLAKQ